MFIERDACRTHRKGERDTVNIKHLLIVEKYRNCMQETLQGTTGTKLLAMVGMGWSGHTHLRTEGHRVSILVHR